MLIFIILPSVSAVTHLNIYVDKIGDSLFLGETDSENVQVPAGVSLKNGKINGITHGLTTKEGDLWTFQYYLLNSEINVVLPPGAVIKNVSNGEIYLDSNKQIAVFVDEGVKIEYNIEDTKQSLFSMFLVPLYALGLVLLIIVISYGVNYVMSYKSKLKKEKVEVKEKLEVVKSVLNERENLIINKLKELGKIKSSLLRKQCDIPKASFSRHLQELEKKGLIKRIGEGKNKFVELVE